MSDLIDRQDAIDAMIVLGVKRAIPILETLPFAEPEQKKGHWIDTDNYYQRWKCSECGCHTRDAEPSVNQNQDHFG